MHQSFKATSSTGNMTFVNLKVWPAEAGFPHLLLANFTLIADFSLVQTKICLSRRFEWPQSLCLFQQITQHWRML